MTIFCFSQNDVLGVVDGVDTSSVTVEIEDEQKLKGIQVNHLIAIQSSKVGQHLIGMVSKIIRKSNGLDDPESTEPLSSFSYLKVLLIGTHYEKDGTRENSFRRTLATVPEINSECYLITGDDLKAFMAAVSSSAEEASENPLSIGTYSLDEEVPALLNGNKLFQRHAVIVGSTGSGKSWCVARLLEQVASLPSANSLLFDIHGEYAPLIGEGFGHYKIAGPNDSVDDTNNVFLPHWLLSYEEMLSMMLDRSDSNAPNQAMIFSNTVIELKRSFLEENGRPTEASRITLDSPIPYSLNDLIEKLRAIDCEMVPGATPGKEKQGPYFGKLTRFIQRLESKKEDKRLNFMFNDSADLLHYEYLDLLCSKLLSPTEAESGGVKVIDFSEVPSDILPLMVSLIARIVFTIQQWTLPDHRHPIALFCDEAHLYMSSKADKGVDETSLQSFERISKEGRKYGIGLVVISQRPSEVNRTVLSQSSNFISLRLTNAEDQSVIKRLLPDGLGDYADILPILDIGEALVVGDASLLPSRIIVTAPTLKPRSATIDFWDEWASDTASVNISDAVQAMRVQSK